MKKNKGFSLVDVLVAIVIVGVIGVCIVNIFAYRARIERKTTLNMEVSSELRRMYNTFSASPDTFLTNYQLTPKNDLYIKNITTNGKTRFSVKYKKEGDFYILEAEIYIDDALYEINNTKKYVRKIYVGGGVWKKIKVIR